MRTQREGPRISSDGDDRRVFWGCKIFDAGIFWVGELAKYFFSGGLPFSDDFFAYSKQSEAVILHDVIK